MFCKKGVLRNFAKFNGKYLCQSLFFNKIATFDQIIKVKKITFATSFATIYEFFFAGFFKLGTHIMNMIDTKTAIVSFELKIEN